MTQQAGPVAADSALDAADMASPVEAVETVTRELGMALGAMKVSFLIADMSGRALVRLAHVQLSSAEETAGSALLAPEERRAFEESATVLPFDGGPAEQTIRTQQVQVVGPDAKRSAGKGGGHWLVLAPVTERGEAIGVLELTLPAHPDAESLAAIARLAHVLAFVVIANGRHTDLFEWGQRTRPLSLSAEIQNRLLPGPQTCEAGSFTLAGWLEPAAAIAGDTFDFNLARDVLHLSLTDAMGHGVAAALTATLCVAGLRNARSAGASLQEQVTSTNQALVDHAAATGLEDFVTGLIGRVDLRTGSADLVNAGHVAPYLVRESRSVPLNLPVHLPLGLFADTVYRTTRIDLHPGDRLVLLTDGMIERNAVSVDFTAAIAETRSLHPREAVRALADRVLEETGNQLKDDATILCWTGTAGTEKIATATTVPNSREPARPSLERRPVRDVQTLTWCVTPPRRRAHLLDRRGLCQELARWQERGGLRPSQFTIDTQVATSISGRGSMSRICGRDASCIRTLTPQCARELPAWRDLRRPCSETTSA